MTHAFHVTLKMKQKQYYILSANQMFKIFMVFCSVERFRNSLNAWYLSNIHYTGIFESLKVDERL